MLFLFACGLLDFRLSDPEPGRPITQFCGNRALFRKIAPEGEGGRGLGVLYNCSPSGY